MDQATIAELMRDINDYAAEWGREVNAQAMIDAAKQEVDTHIIEKSGLWYESLGPDAWNEIDVDMLWRACYHRDAAAVGQVILHAMDNYLFNHEYEIIQDDWEKYSG